MSFSELEKPVCEVDQMAGKQMLTNSPDSNLRRTAFDAFIPMSADSESRKKIIFDFFDLLAAIAARVKNNGLGGRKLSRMSGWWAFEHSDNGEGFNGGYESWKKYVRARAPIVTEC
jgi:Domain of unknown function (DUF1708)